MKTISKAIAFLALSFTLFLPAFLEADPRPTGVRPMTQEEEARIRPRMFRITRPRGTAKGTLPSSCKNITHLPVVTSQGQLGSCAAYATCYYMKTHQEAKENGWVHPDPSVNPERIASPAWGYNIAPRVPAFGDLAVSHYVVADYICEYGIASLAEMPYNPLYAEYDWEGWPSEEAWKRGIEWRGRQAGVIVIHTPEGVDALKEYLAGGNVAVITTHVFSNFDAYPYGEYTNNEVLYHYTEVGYRGGHALTVVGYDDNREYYDSIEDKVKKGAFLCVNSWGTDWGVYEPDMGSKGFIWLPYDFFIQKKNGDPDALIIVDRVNYKPELFATIGINHTRGRKLIAQIYAGQKDSPGYPVQNPQWVKDALPVSNDYPLEDSRIVIDLTDYAHHENLSWYLEVFHLQMYAGTGEINYFGVQQADNLPVVSPDAPVEPEINWYIWLKAGVFSDAGETFNGLRTRRGGVAWADFNRDGVADLLVTGFNWKTGNAVTSTLLFINKGDGTFEQGVTGNLPQLGNGLLAVSDFDNDGYPDVAIHGDIPGDTWQRIAKVYRNNGDNTFTDTGVVLPVEEINSLSWADYDNDGRTDLAVSVGSQIYGVLGELYLYRNLGNGNFSTVIHPIEASGTIVWADYDNDGRIDFIACGRNKTAIYRNAGDGIFTESAGSFPPLRQASAAWGDYDSDGLPDLAVTGRLENNNPFTAVYRNEGSGIFTPVDIPFANLFAGSVVWGDMNNDGLPDLVITGRTADAYSSNPIGTYPHVSIIYLNCGDGSFKNAFAEMPGVSASADITFIQSFDSTVSLSDYDMDGDLDVFLSGTKTYMFTSDPSHIYTGIQESHVADSKGLRRPNTPPQPPVNLLYSPGWEDGAVQLTWDAGNDTETPAAGLYYNVRVGTSPGTSDIFSSVNGTVTPGSVPLQSRKLLLAGLPAGTYYWAVQTIDAGRALSAWSDESSFIVNAYTRKYNLYIDSGQPHLGTTTPAPGLYAYNTGSVVEITAVPFGGYKFSHWSGDVETPLSNPSSVVMDRVRTVTAHFKLAYDISPQWEQKTSNAPWGGRLEHSTVVFDGKIWVLGGNSTLGRMNDVWYSSDGISWTRATENAGWSRRFAHSSFVFNNRIWVLGGYDSTNQYLNDVWSSSNGVDWTQEANPAPWGKRCNFSTLVFDGKMWVMGGSGNGTLFNDVWWSSDGKNWTQATGSAAWNAREGLAAAVFDGKIWVIGGYRNPAQYASDVWYSTDGIVWISATLSAAWAPRRDHTALVVDGKLWIFGGIFRDAATGNWVSCNEVWYSYDGVNWSQSSSTPDWAARYGHTSALFNGQLWVVGGAGEYAYNDAWSAPPNPGFPGTLMLTLSAGEGGTTMPPAGYYYDTPGKVFHLQAVPSYGYRFKDWTGSVSSPASEDTTVILDADKTVKANFEKITVYSLTLTFSPSGSGSILPVAGTYYYPAGSVVPVVATPSYRFAFSHWTGGAADPGSPSTTVLLDGNKSIAANFIPDPFAHAVAIDAGDSHSVFLQDEGTVWTWGLNSSGQLGDGTFISSLAPLVSPAMESAKAVSAGISHTAALKNDGTVWSWGFNAYGQLGTNSFSSSTGLPVQAYNLTNVIALSCGGYYTVALKNDGTVWSWGRNDAYQLGMGYAGDDYSRPAPVQAVGPSGQGYLDGVTAVSAGFAHTLALRQDGSVWAWGNNTCGQLGNENRTSVSYPVKVKGLAGMKGISGGGTGITGDHSLAVGDNGSVWAWGDNRSGQLGDGSNTSRLLPVRVHGTGGEGWLENIRQVAAGGKHSLALDSGGNIWAWGDNTCGQLGDGTNNDRNTPVPVTVVTDAVCISAGSRHSMALDSDGKVWVWGYDVNGQLGNGTVVDTNVPVCLDGIGTGAVSRILTVSVNPSASGTTVPSGTRKYRNGSQAVVTAAAGARYQFSHWSGDASGTETSLSVDMDGNKNVTANFSLIPGIDCRLTMVCSPAGAGFLVPSEGEHEFDVGTVVNIIAVPGYRYRFTGWSANVANPSSAETSVVLEGDTTVTAYFEKTSFQATPSISAGGQFNLILKENGGVWATGYNGNNGSLGINSTVSDASNVQVKGQGGTGYLSGVVSISAGAVHSSAISYDGTVYVWGGNGQGQLGDGTKTARLAPVKVKSPDGTGELAGIVCISAGSGHNAAVKMDGTLWMWGGNSYGQLGINSTGESLFPAQVRGELDRGFLTGAKSVACGPEHTLALLGDGTVLAWGRNHYGQLGNNSMEDSLVPVKSLNLNNIISVEASDYAWGPPFSMALKNDGTVWVWGGGRDGLFGNGTSGEDVLSSTPLQVPGLTGVKAIAAGDFHALALKTDGTVWAWGSNSLGQCGDGTTDNIRTTPVQVKNPEGTGYLTDVIAISAGYTYSMALKSNGTVWYWGMNQFNLFGSGGFLRNSLPVQHPNCQVDTSVEMLYLTMAVLPEGAGTTVPIESIHAYNPGSVVNVRAQANTGFAFSHWSEGSTPYSTDSTVTMNSSKTVTAFFEKVYPSPGDINRDGFINIQDVILGLRMTVGLPITIGFESKEYPYTRERTSIADMNSDGDINIADAILILRLSLGLSTTLPDPYTPRPVAGPETESESVSVNVPAGQEGEGSLNDGTGVLVPAAGQGYSFTLGRITNYVNPDVDFGLDPGEGLSPQTSGSLRTLSIFFDSVLSETEKLSMIPRITIPRKEIGFLNHDTVNIMRISERIIDGKVVKQHGLLPAHFDGLGNLVAKDIYLPNELLAEETLPGKTKEGNAPVYISYIPLTFQGTINWVRPCQLVRMVPDSKAEGKRKPLTALTDKEKEWELKKPIKNVIVLVHGHNESEKTGLAGQFDRNAPFPWAVDYKMNVWEHIYSVFIKEYMEFNSCTVFYEFIYPTWRPIFGHLDDAFVTLITGELEKQLSYNVEEKDSMAFNLFIVAHSMGGVVSRAGIMKFPEVLDDQFKHFVSWGSPHRGAAMYSLRYQITSPAYNAKTWKGSALSSAMSAYVSRSTIDAPGIMDLRWTNGPLSDRRYLKLDQYFDIDEDYASQDDVYNLRTGSLIYNRRLEQLNQEDNRGAKYTLMYGITHQGIAANNIDAMGIEELLGVLQLGEIAIGATINRFLVDNGFGSYLGFIESDSDGAVPISSMTGLGLSPSSMYLLGYGVDHESYYGFHADDTAKKTFEALGFKVNPMYDPPEVTFTYPVEDELFETEENGDVTIQGNLDWKGPRKFEGGVKDIKLFKYTYLQEMVNGFDWQGVEVGVDDENWAIDDTGDFSVLCNIPGADRVYALRVVFVFKDDTEMQAVVMLGPPDELETKKGGETIKWSMEGLGKVFALDNETYVYEQPKEGEMPGVYIHASVIPVFRDDDSTYLIFAGKYSSGSEDPIEDEQNEVRWEAGFEEPAGLSLLEIDFSTSYEGDNFFVIAYDVISLSEPEILKTVTAFIMSWPKREKEDLLPPYCRPQEIPEEE